MKLYISQGVLHTRNCSVCGVDRGIAAVIFFAHGELWIETNGNITRMSGVPGWSRAVILPHQRETSPSFCTQRRQFEFLPPPWWLALGAPVGCFARRPATESATKSMRVIRLADGAVVRTHAGPSVRLEVSRSNLLAFGSVTSSSLIF